MDERIINYLNRLKQKNDKSLFLLTQFYYNPEVSLGGSEDDTLENYYNYGNIKYLVKCDNFLEFLNLCFETVEFFYILNFNLLLKLKLILKDIQKYKENYILETNDDSWLKEAGISKEEVIDIPEELLWILESTIEFYLKFYYDEYIKPKDLEETVLSIIDKDDYSHNSTFLAFHDGTDETSFNTLICNNEFLKICSNTLLKQDLSSVVINNILNILDQSIKFKCLDEFCEDFYYKYYSLSDEKLESFNLKLAGKLKRLFQSKKSVCKVIKLY